MKYKCNNDIKMNIPKDVDFIIKKLEENGYEAFAVGGCKRYNTWERTKRLGYNNVSASTESKRNF